MDLYPFQCLLKGSNLLDCEVFPTIYFHQSLSAARVRIPISKIEKKMINLSITMGIFLTKNYLAYG